MPSVRVERVPVETLSLGRFGFDHLQLVFRSDFEAARAPQEDWFVIEGIRDANGRDVRLAVDGWHGGTTLSDANGGLVGDALTARIGTPESRGPREIAEGSGAVELWATLVSYAAEIEAQKFPYIALALPGSPLPTLNSSSLVSSLLYHAGLDIGDAMPAGLRFSPGKKTLLGTSADETLATGKSFNAVLAGAGDDRLFGRNEQGVVDKLFGGRGDDVIHWSEGFDIVHGGEPGLAYEDDGVDTIDYSGAGKVRLEAPRPGPAHVAPDFIASYAGGEDRLFSIEHIVWDVRSDRLSIGPGVGLSSPPVRIDFGGEHPSGKGDVIDLAAADAGFEIVPAGERTLQFTARVPWNGAEAHGLNVHGAEWIVGSPHGDRFVLAKGLRGVEGGMGDDVFDLRAAERMFVSPGGGENTVIVGAGEIAARSGAGVDRYVIAHPSASLVIDDALPHDRIVVAWTPARVSAAYDAASPRDLVVRVESEIDNETGAEIRVRGHQAGDLGLDSARGIAWVADGQHFTMTSPPPTEPANAVEVSDSIAISPEATSRVWGTLEPDDMADVAECGMIGLSLWDPIGLLGGG
ncbi:hypothetical protein [Hyphomicrobium nitrativorans]|nr:hypothetical protein [Hyphomicrobium nitrativorans]